VDASELDPTSAILRLDDEMVGPPSIEYARRILANARRR